MRTEVQDLKRMDLFHLYHQRSNPFIFVTTKIEITKLYELGKKHKNCYGIIGYYIAKAFNFVEEFKYRMEHGIIYKYDSINPNFTEIYKDKSIGFFGCEMKDTLEEFLKEYNVALVDFHNKVVKPSENDGVAWLSCVPWFHFTSAMVPFDKSITIPQFIWDKFELVDGKCYINMMIMVHHGFADSYHIGLFLEKLNELIENI